MTRWRQSSQIIKYNEQIGEVAVFYLEEQPAADEVLLERGARPTGRGILADCRHAIRISAKRIFMKEKRLTLERQALQEGNDLGTVLAKIEEEKRRNYKDVRKYRKDYYAKFACSIIRRKVNGNT